MEQDPGEERIQSHLQAENGMENTGEGSFQHVDRSVSPWRLRVDAHENRGEATPGTDLVDQFADGTWVQIHSALSKEQKLNEISTYLMQEDEDVEHLHDAFETVPRTEQVQHPERGSSCERPSINQADEPRGDSSQPTDPLCLDHGRYNDQLFAPSVNNDVIMNDVQNMVRVRTEPVEEDVENSRRSVVQAGAGARSSESQKYDKTRGVPLPTSSIKPVGQAFEENTKVIWSLLMDGNASTIGIYGMGGVGKSIILQYIYNELLQRQDICDHVWWVIVSRDFSINRL
jgi:disease resistance protein RPS2